MEFSMLCGMMLQDHRSILHDKLRTYIYVRIYSIAFNVHRSNDIHSCEKLLYQDFGDDGKRTYNVAICYYA